MKRNYFFTMLCLVIVLSSCIQNSDWGKVIIPSNQKIVFSPSNEDLFKNEKNVFVKVGEKEMYITNKNLVNRICYLKLAFPNDDILIQYVKTEENGEIKFDPRFINLAE